MDRTKIILRWILFSLVLLSAYLSMKAMYVDLYNPGSPYARQLAGYNNWILVATFIVSLPLLHDKLKAVEHWLSEWQFKSPHERARIKRNTIRRFAFQISVMFVVLFAAAFVIQHYYPIPEQVVTNYTMFYSTSTNPFLNNPLLINLNTSTLNNTIVNISEVKIP